MNTDELNLTIAHGGKAIYGARLGILMLEARFPRMRSQSRRLLLLNADRSRKFCVQTDIVF